MDNPENFGWAMPKRIELFDKLIADSKEPHRLVFQDKPQMLKVIRIPIQLPKYRILNGRTSTLQEEWLATHPDKGEDFFSRDPESIEVQKVQHELLARLIEGKGLLDKFKSGKQQEEVIILDSNGFVINGNRRLCAWRTLYYSDIKKYGHFSHLDAVVLPACDDKAIDKLEARLQVERDIKDDYTWDAEARMMQIRKELHKLTDKELADFYDTTESAIQESLEMLKYADKYLESKGMAKHWSMVADMDYAFQQIVKNRKKLVAAGDIQLFEDSSFVLLDDPKGGRLYEYIPDLQKHLNKIKPKLYEEFEDQVKASPEADKKLDDLFGGTPDKEGNELALAEIISKNGNRTKAAEVIKDAIESERIMEKDKHAANYVLKMLQKANADVQSAISGIRAESKTTGVQDQVTAIEHGLKTIKEWLANKHA